MTLQEKIIELLPKRAEADDNAHHPQESEEQFYSYNEGYNNALQKVEEKLPEILKLIREEVEKEDITTVKWEDTKDELYTFFGKCECGNSCVIVGSKYCSECGKIISNPFHFKE